MGAFWQDLRYGLRVLRKSPGFAAVAILTLALGIGANTAIFSVVDAALLRPLPYKDPASLMALRETVGKSGFGTVSFPNYEDWTVQNHVFEELAAYSAEEFHVTGGEQTERVSGEMVSDNYFRLLGVAPALGRTFLPEENETPGKGAVAVLSYGLWEQRFGADSSVLGRPVRINDADYIIVGVMPKGFRGFSGAAKIWIPMAMYDIAWPQLAKFDFLHKRDVHWHRVLGRLKPGVPQEQAQADMAAIGDRLAREYPEANRDRSVSVQAARDVLIGHFRTPLFLMLGAVGFVLLIACANVTNLLLARASSRAREIAIRVALGAGRWKLLQQLFTENLWVVLGGAGLGLLLAAWGVDVLASLLPVSLPTFVDIRVDRGVLAFTLLLTALTWLLLGLLPAWKAASPDLNDWLREGARGSQGRHGRRVGGVLVVAEISLAFVLMIGAGLLLRSFVQMLHVDPGFRPDHLLTMRFDVPNRFIGEQRLQFGQRLLNRIATVPAIDSAALTFADPFLWEGFSREFAIEGHAPLPPAEMDTVYYHEISPNFFHTMGIPLLSGRDFTVRDDSHVPRILIVTESFAKRYWPGQNAVGRRIKFGPADSNAPWMEVVGVVGDIRYRSLRQDPEANPVIYAPLEQSEVIEGMNLMARTKGDPEGMAAPLRQAIQQYDSEIPVYHVATVEQRIAEQGGETRAYASLLGFFALLALLLSAVGVYGVMSYAVAQRTHEIGIRMALGAHPSGVLRLVLEQSLKLTLSGLALGVVGALVLTRLLAGLLFGVRETDPITFAVGALLLAAVALAACCIPARRAMRVDPIVALRHE